MEKKVIDRIVKASGISAGERVLVHFWGEDSHKETANAFLAAVAARGATPVYLQQARSVNRAIFENAEERCFPEAYFEGLSGFDTVLDLFAYQPIILGYPLEKAQMDLYRRYIARLFQALMTAKRFLQIRLPTAENAEESGLAPEDYITRMEAAYSIDYDVLQKACGEHVQKLARYTRYELYTGENCVLEIDLTGRVWHIDAGDGDWPCGEVYIAPVEGETNGSVFFPKLILEDVGTFENVTLLICGGNVEASSDDGVNAFLAGLAPEDKVVCELGLGQNPNVKDLCGYTVLDEKMAGTFHIAIGANNMFGGENKTSLHLDMVNPGAFQLKPKEVIL